MVSGYVVLKIILRGGRMEGYFSLREKLDYCMLRENGGYFMLREMGVILS